MQVEEICKWFSVQIFRLHADYPEIEIDNDILQRFANGNGSLAAYVSTFGLLLQRVVQLDEERARARASIHPLISVMVDNANAHGLYTVALDGNTEYGKYGFYDELVAAESPDAAAAIVFERGGGGVRSCQFLARYGLFPALLLFLRFGHAAIQSILNRHDFGNCTTCGVPVGKIFTAFLELNEEMVVAFDNALLLSVAKQFGDAKELHQKAERCRQQIEALENEREQFESASSCIHGQIVTLFCAPR